MSRWGPRLAYGLVVLAVAAGFGIERHDAEQGRKQNAEAITVANAAAVKACRISQVSWDNKFAAWHILTAPAVYPPTLDAELLERERQANDQQAARQKALLSGLGERPACGDG